MENFSKCTDRKNIPFFRSDNEILRSILPCNIWAYTTKILEQNHPTSLENLSNSSLYFRNLILSKRTLFLFPQVFKLIGLEFENQKNTKIDGSNITKCRTICKSWSKRVDEYIYDGTPEPDFFNTEHPLPSDHALLNARYQYFGHKEPTKLPRFLAHFQERYLTYSKRNPFIGKVVFIDLTGFRDNTQWASIANEVSTLLRKYGHYIRILNLQLFKHYGVTSNDQQIHLWLVEWLKSCPNLTHLKVSEYHSSDEQRDVAFGILPVTTRPSREFIFERNDPIRPQNENFFNRVIQAADLLIQQRRQNADILQQLFDVELLYVPVPLPHANNFDFTPMPTLKNLQCLKLIHLSALNFNSIISENTHVAWLQIEALDKEKRRYNNYFPLEFPNLIKLYLQVCSLEEVRNLRNIHQSWFSLTHLHFEDCKSPFCISPHNFIEWIEIFKLISENWRNTLTDLTLRLPIPNTEKEKENVARYSGKCRLDLPNLKRLKIWLRNELYLGVAKTAFIDMLRIQLEQLIIE